MRPLLDTLHAAFHEPATRVYRVVQGTVWALILLSIAFLTLEALLPENSSLAPLLGSVDRIVLVIFAIELTLTACGSSPTTSTTTTGIDRHRQHTFRAHFPNHFNICACWCNAPFTLTSLAHI